MSDEARQVHLRGALGTVRTETLGGREHLVVPVIALMEGVIHAVNAPVPERVTARTLAKAAASWNGRPLVLGHPVRNGTQVSANDPLVLEQHGFGTIFNSRMSGTKLLMDAYVDPERAEKVGGAKFLERIKSGDPIEVSVGAYVQADSLHGTHNGKAYRGTWLETTGDHLAFLPDGVGACSMKMGCGAHRAAGALNVLEIDEDMLDDLLEEDLKVFGGPGSGNFGHGSQVEKADKASSEAKAASEKARASGTKEDHNRAVSAHRVAAGAQHEAGNSAKAKEHQGSMAHHERRAKESEARGLGGPGSGNWGHGGEGHKEASDAHTAAAAAHQRAADAHKNGGSSDAVHSAVSEASKATSTAQKASKETGAKPYGSQAAGAYVKMAKEASSPKLAAQYHSEAAKYHTAAARDHSMAAKSTKLKGASMHEKLKNLLAPFLKSLDDAGDADGGDGDGTPPVDNVTVEEDDDTCAEMITYEALRALIEQAKVSLDEGSKHIDALIEAEMPAEGDTEAEKVEVARLEALIAMCVQLYGTTNGMVKIASNALRPDNSTSSMAYMEARVAAGRRHSASDQEIVQQTHDNAVKLGADCAAMKAAAGTPCGCGGHSAEGENEMTRKENIDALVALKDAGFTDAHKQGFDILPDAMLTSLHTLAGKSPADAIIQAKFAADSALAGHAHGINSKEAAEKKKADDEAALKNNGGKETVEMKAAAAKMTVEEFEEAEYLKTAPQSVRTLVANEKARNASRKTELVNSLKALGALTESELNTRSLDDLETMARFAKVETKVDFSGRGIAALSGDAKDVYMNPPDPYALALEARKK